MQPSNRSRLVLLLLCLLLLLHSSYSILFNKEYILGSLGLFISFALVFSLFLFWKPFILKIFPSKIELIRGTRVEVIQNYNVEGIYLTENCFYSNLFVIEKKNWKDLYLVESNFKDAEFLEMVLIFSDKLIYGPAKRNKVRSWYFPVSIIIVAIVFSELDAHLNNKPLDRVLLLTLLTLPCAFLGVYFAKGISDFNRINWALYKFRQNRKVELKKRTALFFIINLFLSVLTIVFGSNVLMSFFLLLGISFIGVMAFYKLKFNECFSRWLILPMTTPSIVIAWSIIIITILELYTGKLYLPS